MTTSSEDVLLQMGEVRYKKGDGTLYVMNERLAWMAENRDTVAVSHRYADIKMQKISPEGKPKVQLQVVLHDGNSSTFHFVNRNGQQAMLDDRDKVKELLQQLLPNFKRKVDKELEEKNRILSENPDLLQLYKDLVIPQVVSSEEFWDNHAKEHAMKKTNGQQEQGISAAFLADIKPQTDGCNGLKYNLTADIVHSIFKTYPAVKRKHGENVPNKLSESEFWTKFFQSHYFHRDRITTGTKDIFTECSKIDDQVLRADVQKRTGDPLLDLEKFDDVPVDECGPDDDDTPSSANIVHQNMIKRFNQHSIMVLKTCTEGSRMNDAMGPLGKSSSSRHKSDKNNGETSKEAAVAAAAAAAKEAKDAADEVPIKRQRLIDKIYYEDLGEMQSELEGAAKDGAQAIQPIQLARVERYLNGPVTAANADMQVDQRTMEEVQNQMLRQTELWKAGAGQRNIVSPTAAVNALGELSPGGALMRGFQEQSVGQLVPPEYEKDLRHLYLSAMELLKHFWPCFPPISPELEVKAKRMHDALQRFKVVKLAPFENRAMHELLPLGASLTQHLNSMLKAANQKFLTWQERQMRQNR